MEIYGQECRLLGEHFCVNIALEENSGGLVRIERDPRRMRIKPAAYVGTVEECAASCKLVKTGDKVVLERWIYEQVDVDSERIIARERDLLILANETPGPNVLVLQIMKDEPPKMLFMVPDTWEPAPRQYYCGMVLASSSKVGEPGEILWVQKSDLGQFVYADGERVAFRNDGRAHVMMRGWTREYQAYKREQLGLTIEQFRDFCDEINMQDLPGGELCQLTK